MRLMVDIPDDVVDDIVSFLPRDNPRKSWTAKEKRMLIKEWLEDTAYMKANQLPGRNHQR